MRQIELLRNRFPNVDEGTLYTLNTMDENTINYELLEVYIVFLSYCHVVFCSLNSLFQTVSRYTLLSCANSQTLFINTFFFSFLQIVITTLCDEEKSREVFGFPDESSGMFCVGWLCTSTRRQEHKSIMMHTEIHTCILTYLLTYMLTIPAYVLQSFVYSNEKHASLQPKTFSIFE